MELIAKTRLNTWVTKIPQAEEIEIDWAARLKRTDRASPERIGGLTRRGWILDGNPEGYRRVRIYDPIGVAAVLVRTKRDGSIETRTIAIGLNFLLTGRGELKVHGSNATLLRVSPSNEWIEAVGKKWTSITFIPMPH